MIERGKIIGVSFAALFHLLLLLLFFTTGFKAIYPPPQEQGIEIEFEPLPPRPISVSLGREPRAEQPTPEEEIRLVQRAQSPLEGNQANRGDETTMGESGDVELFEPPREEIIEQRALFPSAKNADSLAAQRAKSATEVLEAGHAAGNTKVGSTEGEPQAQLAGRSVEGFLPKPEYNVNKGGRVVVAIVVDQYGKVVKADISSQGTTVQDATLWEAAKKAAMRANFNQSASAPAMQQGTITYIFRLR